MDFDRQDVSPHTQIAGIDAEGQIGRLRIGVIDGNHVEGGSIGQIAQRDPLTIEIHGGSVVAQQQQRETFVNRRIGHVEFSPEISRYVSGALRAAVDGRGNGQHFAATKAAAELSKSED